ncbi:hypothetical protein D3C77_311730 [compost metagenome]
MFAHVDLVTALASVQAGLLLHALVLGVQFVLAGAEAATRPAGTNDGDARPSADIGLFGLVVVGVLKALQRQVASNVGDDLVGVDLCALERGIPSADQAGLVASIQRGLGPGGAVAFLVTRTFVGIGEDAQATPFRPDTNAGANRAAAAAVLAVQLLRVGRSLKVDIAFGGQQQVVAGLELAALYADVTRCTLGPVAGGDDGQVVATGQAAALADCLLLGLASAGFLPAQRDGDADELPGVFRGHATVLLRGLPGLDTGQASLDTLQGGESAVVFLVGLPDRLVGAVNRAANRAGQGQGQATALALGGLLAAVVVFGGDDVDVLPDQGDVLAGDDFRALHPQVLARLDGDVAEHAAHGAGLGALTGAGGGVFQAG